MNNLVIMQDQQAVTTSLMIAEVFEKEHKTVIRAIEDKIQSAQNYADYNSMFFEGVYVDARNREQKQYFMNRDGFSFIAFGFTGKEADKFKLQYISAFNEMERRLTASDPTSRLALITADLLSVTEDVTKGLNNVRKDTDKNTEDIDYLKYQSEITDEQALVITDAVKTKVRAITGYPSEYYKKFISDLYKYLKRYHMLGSKVRTTKKGNFKTVLEGIRTYSPDVKKLKLEHDEYIQSIAAQKELIKMQKEEGLKK